MGRLRSVLELLEENPEAGSTDVRPSLKERFGEGIRKFPTSTFVLIYRYDGKHVDILALAYGKRVV
jgi:plasmid stabilization system protein ParE